MAVLSVNGLSINYETQGSLVRAVSSLNLTLERKAIMGIVGESGSGKSSLGLAIMRLLPKNARTSGEIILQDLDVTSLDGKNVPSIRGTGMTMIFQEPMTSLNPVMRVSEQLAEAIMVRRERSLAKKPTKAYQLSELGSVSREDTPNPAKSLFGIGFRNRNNANVLTELTRKEIIDALRKVRISDPERTATKYPHELSGGERQRVMISMAYLLRPKLLIADEPTTALDVTTQAQILKLMLGLRDEIGTAILLISHDLLVVGQIADHVAVLYAGEVMELASTDEIFKKPMHPYTRGLIGSIPKGYKKEGRISPIPPSPQGEITQKISGCKFNSRCGFVMEKCKIQKPELVEIEPNHHVSCYLF